MKYACPADSVSDVVEFKEIEGFGKYFFWELFGDGSAKKNFDFFGLYEIINLGHKLDIRQESTENIRVEHDSYHLYVCSN